MPVREPWIERVERRLMRCRERGLGKVWVVAVSGGSDSVGLLRVLHHLAGPLGLQLSIAHLNHGVRGESARADAEFVADLARSLGWPCDLGTWQPTRTSHFESDARRARYDWLTKIAGERGASVIAVGHTVDDQAETILHRILRGTGPRGLAGIPWLRALTPNPRVTLVRPLLRVSRAELRAYLATLDQPFREDASNTDVSRTRARIRHDLLPRLAAEYNPNVARALVRLGALTSSLEKAIEAELRDLEQSVMLTSIPNGVALKHGLLRSFPAYQRAEVVRRIWRRSGWPEASMSARRWRRLAALIDQDEIPGVDLGAGVEIWTDQVFLFLRRRPAPEVLPAATDRGEPIPVAIPGLTIVPWARGSIEARVDPDPAIAVDETMDLDQVSLPVCVRRARPGDRFAPLGMRGQSTPLADFFRGRNVPRDDRTRIPLVCDQIGIIWVVGHRIADRVKVTTKTAQRLGLRWSGGGKVAGAS